jgi:hypothetical protein
MPEQTSFQSTQVMERHVTYITVIWSLLHMFHFILLQIMLNGKVFLPNITSKWTHFTMHTLIMLLHITLRNNPFLHTSHHTDDQDCVCTYDVSSDHSDHCRTYYKHRKRTDALQYVNVDVSSDYSCHRMTYYTHYMSTETAVCVCVCVRQ